MPPSHDLDAFDYALPPAQIAFRPARRRDDSKLLDARHSQPEITKFSRLPSLLQKGDLAVVNDSKVIPARLKAVKESGGRAEIFAERFLPDGEVLAQVRASKPPAVGARLFAGGVFAVREKTADGFYRLRAENRKGEAVAARPRFLRRGETPLPPYIRRPPDADDKRRYQTVFARRPGSVAAPTAGLHFTPAVLAAMAARGIGLAKITLHVGAGTFSPPRRGLSADALHSEKYRISPSAAAKINAAKKRGGRILAVGTTTLRALESAADENGALSPAEAETDLFVKPGFPFRVADVLLTNFHLPRSSLLVLACAFGGREKVLRVYRAAVRNGFRFYSYGDAMLLSRAQ
ncbi:MAG: tRNA preQ1(34) S-adenosylmethionine ribosyltransferase-isomerase QueA [Gammaproteobacteria bacterium]